MRRWYWLALLAAGCIEPQPGYADSESGGGTSSTDPGVTSWTSSGPTSTPEDSPGTSDTNTSHSSSGTPTMSEDSTTSSTTDPTTTASSSGNGRVTQDLLVLYEFDEGMGTSVLDTSGLAPPLDLEISDIAAVTWQPSGLVLSSGAIAASSGPATKVLDGCQTTNEITIEAWFTPATAAVDPHQRIVTMSADTLNRNFTLAYYNWDFASMPALSGPAHFVRLRTDTTNPQGYPNFIAAKSATATLTHVVHTWKSDGTEVMHIDGVAWPDIVRDNGGTIVTGPRLGTFANWDPSYKLAIANELTNDRPFLGELHLIAIYRRALSALEVQQNFSAGF